MYLFSPLSVTQRFSLVNLGYLCTNDTEILDSAAFKYQVKFKEFKFTKWEKPDLNQQVKHLNLT